MTTGRIYVVHEPIALLDPMARKRHDQLVQRKVVATLGDIPAAVMDDADSEGKGKEKEQNAAPLEEEGLSMGQKEKEKGGEHSMFPGKGKEKEIGGREEGEKSWHPIMRESSTKAAVLFYLPGRNETAWYAALKQTKWRKVANEVDGGILVVYGQAKGDLGDGERDSPALTNWDTVYSQNDLAYISEVLDDIASRYPETVDHSKVFLLGYGSGGNHTHPMPFPFCHTFLAPVNKHTIGMLSFNITVEYGGTLFAAICNYMGGVQLITEVRADELQERGILDPRNAKNKCPVSSRTVLLQH